MSLARLPEEERRAPREMVDCEARVWTAALPPAPARLVNVSPYGCMIRCGHSIPIGDRIAIDLAEHGSLRGHVIWSLGARTGIEFHRPITVEAYLELLSHLSGPEPV